MAFNADEYISVIVEQIAGNFQDLHHAVTIVPKLEKEKDKLIASKKKTDNPLKEREQVIKVSLYEQSIGSLVCNYDAYRTIEPLTVGLFLFLTLEQQLQHGVSPESSQLSAQQ